MLSFVPKTSSTKVAGEPLVRGNTNPCFPDIVGLLKQVMFITHGGRVLVVQKEGNSFPHREGFKVEPLGGLLRLLTY